MNDLSSPRLQVRIDGSTAPARVLADLKNATDLGLFELRALIASGVPVLDVEMFTNDWYDSGATRLFDLLTGWEARGIRYILSETSTNPNAGDVAQISLAELRNIIRSGEDDRTRMEELDNLRHGGIS